MTTEVKKKIYTMKAVGSGKLTPAKLKNLSKNLKAHNKMSLIEVKHMKKTIFKKCGSS